MREMKDSGIEWIGEIPKDWDIIPNKRVMKKSKLICDKYQGQNVISLTMNGVIVRDIENPVGKMPLTFDGYQIVNSGNLLMCLFDIDVTPRCVGVIYDDGVTSPAYSQFILLNGNVAEYFYYYYLNLDYTKELLHLAKNLRHSLTESQLGEIYVPVPPISEQQRIASYLDTKCSKIDDIIEKQQSVIEKLKAYKASIITEAVTKGLNSDVSMKDSGVEWIGAVPEHWETKKLKYVGKFVNGYAFPSNAFRNSGTLVMKISNIQPMKIIWDEKSFVDKKYEDLTSYCVHKGDLVFALTRPIINGGIKTAIANNHETVLLNQRNAMFKGNREISTKWQYYLMQSKMFIQEFALYIDGTGQQPNISTNEISNIKVMLPDLKEQKQIADYLDQKCSAIDSTIANKQALIEKLTAYKKSLIYEVVTGKKEV